MLTRLKSAAADEVFKVDHAQTGGSDLIVMATHGRTASRTCSWEASRKAVLRRAPCPVLTVRMWSLQRKRTAQRRQKQVA